MIEKLVRLAWLVKKLILIHLLKDSQAVAYQHWLADDGDKTLRLDYPLNSKSLVADVGGYNGDFCSDILSLYSCSVMVFEPVKAFYDICTRRFANEHNVQVFHFGLGNTARTMPIFVDGNASGFIGSRRSNADREQAEIEKASSFFKNQCVASIDLIKINIEGGEYDLMTDLLDSGYISKIRFIQIQFHRFDRRSADLRKEIREKLLLTHRQMWCYEFIWESWELLP